MKGFFIFLLLLTLTIFLGCSNTNQNLPKWFNIDKSLTKERAEQLAKTYELTKNQDIKFADAYLYLRKYSEASKIYLIEFDKTLKDEERMIATVVKIFGTYPSREEIEEYISMVKNNYPPYCQRVNRGPLIDTYAKEQVREYDTIMEQIKKGQELIKRIESIHKITSLNWAKGSYCILKSNKSNNAQLIYECYNLRLGNNILLLKLANFLPKSQAEKDIEKMFQGKLQKLGYVLEDL